MRHLFIAALAVTASCSGASRPSPGAFPSLTQTAGASAMAVDTTPRAAQLARGRETVSTICVGCHSDAPLPKLAPPFQMVAMHYRRAGTDSAAAAAIVAWVRTPAAERSLLPPMAIRRYGLMPALPLDEGQLQDAALYVLSLNGANGMRGMRRMRGMGVMPMMNH